MKMSATTSPKRKPDRNWLQAAHDAGGAKYLRGYDEEPMDLQAAGENDQKLPIVTGTMYSGGLLNVGMSWPVVLDLADTSLVSQQVPMHREHERNRIVGHTTQIDLAAKNIKFKGVISGVGPDAEEVKGTAKNGFPWRPSLGSGYRRLEYVDRGQKVTVNGRSFSGPIYIARGATIREMGIVTIAGDDNSSAAIAATHQEREMNPFEKWLEAKGIELATLSDSLKKVLEASYKAEQKAAEEAESARVLQLQAAHRESGNAGNPSPFNQGELLKSMREEFRRENLRVLQIQAAFCGQHPEEEAKAIADENYTAEKAELFVLRAGRPKAPPIGSESGEEDPRIYACAMARNQGVGEKTLAAMFGDKAANETNSSKYRGFGPQAMMDLVMLRAGFSWSGSRKTDDYLHRHREAELKLKASGFSTVALSSALQSTVRAIVLETWNAQQPKWPSFCGVRSHMDFKIHKHIRINAAGSVRVVGADGQLASMSLETTEATLQLKTLGTRLTLTRQDKIDDDLGILTQVPKVLTRAFAVRVDEEAFKLLLSLIAGGTFFTTAKGNALAAGAGSAFSSASLTLAAQAFADLVDPNGKTLLAEPDRLLGGSLLKQAFEEMYLSEKIVTGSTGDNPDANIHRNAYKPFTSPFINNTKIRDQDKKALTGQSSTAWLLLCNPEVMSVVNIAFLNGQQTPIITDAVQSDDILGETMQMYHDVGVGEGDDLAGVYSPGA
jgi:hypothetical protein